jgi:hypothetical protein
VNFGSVIVYTFDVYIIMDKPTGFPCLFPLKRRGRRGTLVPYSDGAIPIVIKSLRIDCSLIGILLIFNQSMNFCQQVIYITTFEKSWSKAGEQRGGTPLL